MNEEEKKNELAEEVENTVSEAAETVEEKAEEVVEAAAEVVEDTAETVEQTAEAVTENPVGYSEDEVTTKARKVSKGAIAAIAGIAVVIVAIAVAVNMIFMGGKAKKGSSYDGDYLDIDGTTAAEIADQQGMEYADFLAMYGLPEDLPGETNSNATENLIPLSKYAELSGSDMAQLREQMGWDETFTDDMTLGEARDKTPLSKLVGDESLDQFKSVYGLDDSVNGETLFSEVRHQVEQKEKEMYEEQKKAEEESAKAEENKDEAEVEESEAPTENDKADKAEEADKADK